MARNQAMDSQVMQRGFADLGRGLAADRKMDLVESDRDTTVAWQNEEAAEFFDESDPEGEAQLEAFRQMTDPGAKESILERARAMRSHKDSVTRIQQSMDLLGSHPRGKAILEGATEAMQRPGANVASIEEEVNKASDKLEASMAVEWEANSYMEDAQQWFAQQKERGKKINPKWFKAMGRLQRMVSAQGSNPDLEMMTRPQLQKLIDDIEDGETSETSERRMTDEARADERAKIEQGFAAMGARHAQAPEPPSVNGSVNGQAPASVQSPVGAVGPNQAGVQVGASVVQPQQAQAQAPVDTAVPAAIQTTLEKSRGPDGMVSWKEYGWDQGEFDATTQGGNAQAQMRGKESRKKAREELKDYLLTVKEGAATDALGRWAIGQTLTEMGFSVSDSVKVIIYITQGKAAPANKKKASRKKATRKKDEQVSVAPPKAKDTSGEWWGKWTNPDTGKSPSEGYRKELEGKTKAEAEKFLREKGYKPKGTAGE